MLKNSIPRFLKYLWPVFNIMHERINNKNTEQMCDIRKVHNREVILKLTTENCKMTSLTSEVSMKKIFRKV